MTRLARTTLIGTVCVMGLSAGLPSRAAAPTAMRLVEATTKAGIDFRHVDGRSGRRYFLETVGSGAAFFDADADGFADLYLVNGASLPGASVDVAPTNRLYRNDGDGTFTDATTSAGVGDTGYGSGCAAADYDNDGDLDLYVTNFGPNVLYRNDGDGSFTDVTARAGVGDDRWSLSCAFADYDNDRHVDLYVTNYIDFSFDEHETCTQAGFDVYCSPELFRGASDTLYRNRGDGTFEDVTRAAGVYAETGKGMGVVFGDYDADGFVDCYVANDVGANYLYRNNGDGTFENVAWIAGVEGDENGYTQGTMGVDFGDIDGDGLFDLVGLNYQKQPNALYRNEGGGFFEDISLRAGLGYSLPLVGWGTDFLDLDNDGDLDVFVANGHLQDRVEAYDSTTSYAQLNQVLLNDGAGGYTIADDPGPGLQIRKSSRGVASADIDNDGDLDLLVTNAADAPDLLVNDGPARPAWLRVRLAGVQANRGGIGARVTVTAGGATQADEVRSGSGYLSQNDLVLHFGLGAATQVDGIEVRWPSGHVDTYADLPANRTITITEGADDVDAGERR